MDPQTHDPPAFWRSPAGLTLAVAVVVGGFYLLTEHTTHLLGVLPYLIVLACPLMHVFMHRGHRHGHRHGQPGSNDDEQHRQ